MQIIFLLGNKLERISVEISRVRLFVTRWTVAHQATPSILQARILEWVAISFSRGSSQPRDGTWVSCIAGRLFTTWATREAHMFCVKNRRLSEGRDVYHALNSEINSTPFFSVCLGLSRWLRRSRICRQCRRPRVSGSDPQSLSQGRSSGEVNGYLYHLMLWA